MEVLRTWILGVTVSAMVLAEAQAVMPPGTVRQVGKFTGGLILTLALLLPITRLNLDSLYDTINALPAGGDLAAQQTWHTDEVFRSIIERQLAAYVTEKAEELGASCTAGVVCQTGEDGVPVPKRVTVRGYLTVNQHRALSQWLTREMGIPKEDQVIWEEEGP